MKVTLRKANALQAAITEAVNGLDLSTEVSINEFETPLEKIQAEKKKFSANLATRSKLLGVLYDIRRAVAQANADAGINSLLATVAMLDKNIVLYTRLSKLLPATDNAVINGRLSKIKNRGEEQYYGRDDTVQTTLFDAAEIEDFKSQLAAYKKQKVGMQDLLLEMNVDTEIELDDDAEKLLIRIGII